MKRLSNSEDRIPLMISERLIDVTRDYTGEYIMVNGQFRSYNRHEEQKNRLIIICICKRVEFIDEELMEQTNSIFLDGYICKLPVYRKTPLGGEKSLTFAGGEQTIWKIRLHTMYLLGEEMRDMLLHLK